MRATEERVEAHMMLTTVVQFLSVTSGGISYSLLTGYSHAGGKAGEAGSCTLHLVSRLRMNGAIPGSSYTPTWRV